MSMLPADDWSTTVNTLVGPGGLLVSLVTALVVYLRLNGKKPLDRETVTEKFTSNVQSTYQGMVDDLREEMARLSARVESAERRADEANARADAASQRVDRVEGMVSEVRHNVHAIIDWFDEGAPPPPPVALDWLRTWARHD